MKLDIDTLVLRLGKDPQAVVPISRGVDLTASFNRIYVKGLAQWRIIVRLIDRTTGVWFAAGAAPFDLGYDRGVALRAALKHLSDR